MRIGQVHADAQGVGAGDDLEHALLGELLDQPPVAGEHAGVVHADAVAQQAGQVAAEAGRHLRLGERLAHDRLGLVVELGDAGHGRGHGHGVLLGEVHEVERGGVLGEQLLDRVVEQGASVLERAAVQAGRRRR